MWGKPSSTALLSASIAAAVIIGRRTKGNRKSWTASSLQRWNKKLNILGEVILNSYATFRNFTRMTASAFELLLQLIGPRIKKQDTNMREDTQISKHLAVTLCFLATGDSYSILFYAFSICVSAISTILPKVCQTIRSLKGYVNVSKK
jgi:hypothetical protein